MSADVKPMFRISVFLFTAEDVEKAKSHLNELSATEIVAEDLAPKFKTAYKMYRVMANIPENNLAKWTRAINAIFANYKPISL